MSEIRLENWSIRTSSSYYKAPEQMKFVLCGNVYGHLGFEDGARVTTTSVKSIAGRKAKTKNTAYVLGEINSDYAEWVKENNPTWKYVHLLD